MSNQQWRMLEPGEIVKEGDEFIRPGYANWTPVEATGQKVTIYDYPIRRSVPQPLGRSVLDAIAQPFADQDKCSPSLTETDRLRADADHLLSLIHDQTKDFAEVLAVVGRINARVERLEGMIPKSASATSAVEPAIHAADAQGGGVAGRRFERSLSIDSMSLGKDGNVTARFVAAAEIEAAVPIAAGCAAPETPANGMRTERVVLEVTHCDVSTASQWLWHNAMAEFCPTKAWQIESVRVVEESCLLARSTPPEVVLPRDRGGESYDSFVAGWNNYRDEALKALAAAGVAVKEVER